MPSKITLGKVYKSFLGGKSEGSLLVLFRNETSDLYLSSIKKWEMILEECINFESVSTKCPTGPGVSH